jgi:DNA invertase Pin-like site-specific DNA recombinase
MTHFAVYPRPKKKEDDPSVLLRAAQYVRMSTEHQQYSIANQSAAIALYAAAHNLGIVRSFVDGGKTGVTIKRRRGLQDLLDVVESGMANFRVVIVYDVSRWGRFPDNDESAHYEFVCKRAGISVQYCAEQFENDNSPTSNLLKALKRTMASEYSRELSVKVSAGQRRLASMGFWQGGNAPFGMMRQLVDMNRAPKGVLGLGEWKSISTDRILLTPGPPEAVATVKLAFDLYTERGKNRYQIAEILNKAKKFRRQTPWTIVMLRDLFIDPIYKGSYAYGKNEVRPGMTKRVPPDKWLLREKAFPAIISEKQWSKARKSIQDEIKPLVDSEMLDDLRRLWKIKGRLNSDLINSDKRMPSAVAYRNHFGGINEAYRLIGYPIPKPYTFINVINLSRRLSREVCSQICDGVKSVGGTAEKLPDPNTLLLNKGVTVHVSVCRGRARPKLPMIWTMLVQQPVTADVAIIARMKPPVTSILDYFVFPAAAQMRGAWHTREKDNDAILELYRADSLSSFVESFRRFPHRGFS